MGFYKLREINSDQLEKDLMKLGIVGVLKKYKITSNYITNIKRRK